MSEKRKRIGAIDIAIILLIAAAVAAFAFRGEIRKWFSEEADRVVTYEFRVENVDPAVAARLNVKTVLLASDGSSLGEVLVCTTESAENSETLTDGTVVGVPNGKLNLTGSVSARGYLSGEFVCLQNGETIVPGGTLRVSTGDAVFELLITSVQSH